MSAGRTPPYAITLVAMLAAALGVSSILPVFGAGDHLPGAATSMPPQQDFFAQSDAYERFMGRWSRKLAPAFLGFVSVSDGDAILDIGSGTGALAFAAAERPSVRVTGVDPSSGYVRYAQSKASGDRVKFLVGDAQALDLPDATFDRTLSLLVINFIPQPAKALREMIRVTRPGGTVAAAVWDYPEGMEMLRVFWDEAVALDPSIDARDERHMPLCKRGEPEAAWRTAGLQKVEERPLTIEMTFASFDDYWQPFLGGQGPAGAHAVALAEPARTALAARIRGRLLGGRQGGSFTMRARAWAVKGTVPAR